MKASQMPAKTITPKAAVAKKPAAKIVALTQPPGKKTPAAANVSAKPAAVAAEPGNVVVALRVKDLVERVSASGDFKKNDVRNIVEATLAELGRALEAGQQLNLPPFGKLRVGKSRDLANGTLITLKLRRITAKPGGKKAAAEALADAEQAG